MCGHGIVGVITMGIETGRFKVTEDNQKFIIDSPAGEVVAYAKSKGSVVESVSFENVPSFVLKKDLVIELEGRSFTADVAYGGAFYAVVESKDLGLSVSNEDLPAIQKWGTKIKRVIEEQMEIVHPLEKGLNGIYGVIFSDTPRSADADLRNVTIFADEQVDRSPCGTGTCARLATLYEKGIVQKNGSFVHESITGGSFTGKVLSVSEVGPYQAVIPEITGQAFLTGIHQFFLDPRDSLPQGFLLEKKELQTKEAQQIQN